MNKNLLITISIFMLAISIEVFAGVRCLASRINIVGITNTASNEMRFSVIVANGDGSHDCEDGAIVFPLSAAGVDGGNNERIHDRAFTLAMLAYTSGRKVDIFTYEDAQTCSRAAYIELLYD